MSKLSFAAGFAAGKLERDALRALGRRGSQAPGWRAVWFCKEFIGRIDKPGRIICVTGTNGKTTTCNLIEDSLRALGTRLLDNSFGSNTRAGVASALIAGTNAFNKCSYDTAVFEVDERSSPHIYPYMTPQYLVVTNLFRDSIKRNANPDFIKMIIESKLPKETTLVLNADDLISSSLAPDNPRVYYSVAPLPGESAEENIINDARRCPVCGARMEYEFRRYHHIGRARCPKCGLNSPEPDYRTVAVDTEKNTLTLEVKGRPAAAEDGGERTLIELPLINPKITNIYNETATAALLLEMGYTPDAIREVFSKVQVTTTRYDSVEAGGVKIESYMFKGENPVAGSRLCSIIGKESGAMGLLFTVDDLYTARDGIENVSWYYELDFELLRNADVKRIYLGGKRADDLKLRLLLAGFPEEMLVTFSDEEKAAEVVDLTGLERFILLFDLTRHDQAEATRDKLAARARSAARTD
ncbi:MAG: MurT ligase domain-containing protein [Clostridia bacterium]|nr:MurT ligase domain-containing protein [Clostridia bacterium]